MDIEACIPGTNNIQRGTEFNDITYSGFKPNRNNKAINVGGVGWC